MKIQINNIETLERLIGGDTELEFDIRQSVVESFTKKHLKSIANTTAMATVANALKKEIIDELLISVKSGSGSYFQLTPQLTDALKNAINNDIKNLIYEKLDEVLKSEIGVQQLIKRLEFKLQETEDKLNRFAKKVEDRTIEAVVKIDTEIQSKVLEGKIDKMVNDKIKAKFNL